jgi:hypothetical protein
MMTESPILTSECEIVPSGRVMRSSSFVKGLLQEINQSARTLNGQIRLDGVVAVRNWFDGHLWSSLEDAVERSLCSTPEAG